MKLTSALRLFTFTPYTVQFIAVHHCQCPMLVVILPETRADTMSCTDAVHKNNYCIHILPFVLDLGSNPTPQTYERWPPFCHPGINHPQGCSTMQAKLEGSHTCGED